MTRLKPVRHRTFLSSIELEDRSNPSFWLVSAPVDEQGTPGITDAAHTGEIVLQDLVTVFDGSARVLANNPVYALAAAFQGGIQVDLAGAVNNYEFNAGNLGTAASAEKPFLMSVTGTSVLISFEDMAGQPGCDYDYNNRSWTVSLSPSEPRLVYQGSFPIAGPNPYTPSQQWIGNIDVEVTEQLTGDYKWEYTVANGNFGDVPNEPQFAGIEDSGIGIFNVLVVDTAASITEPTSTRPWFYVPDFVDPVRPGWVAGTENSGAWLMPGESGMFSITTPPRPVVPTAVEIGTPEYAYTAGTFAVGPGPLPNLKADIDIADRFINNQNMFVDFDETTEDSVGGLVVKRAEGNAAPTQQIIVKPILDANTKQPVAYDVLLAYPNNVRLFIGSTGPPSIEILSGTRIKSSQLPLDLYVMGRGESASMRDVKIVATPIQGPFAFPGASSDEVAFTVVWVDVSLKFDGRVTAENTARANYMMTTANKGDNLGLQLYEDFGSKHYGLGFEAKGTVSPANFDYPSVKIFMSRDVSFQGFQGNNKFGEVHPFSPAPAPAPGNDVSYPIYRDDTPPLIFDLDAPGAQIGPAPQNTISRYRANFKTFAQIGDLRALAIKLSNTRVSVIQTAAGENGNAWTTASDAAGDNGAGEGLINLTFDLKAPPAP